MPVSGPGDSNIRYPNPGYRAGSARLGQTASGRKGVSVTYDTRKLIALTDKITGQFRPNTGSFQRALAEVNGKAAEVIARGMVEKLEEGIDRGGRKQRGTNWLSTSLLAEENKEWYANSIIVGKESWLEESPAQNYWRGIEEGIGSYTTQALFSAVNGPPGVWGGPQPYSSTWGGKMKWPRGDRRGKEIRMPQFMNGSSKVKEITVRAFGGYHYSRGGAIAFRDFRIKDQYEIALRSVDINMSDVLATRKKRA